MDGQEVKNITVVIAGRPYPLKVQERDEPSIRKIVNEINEKVNDFQLTYTNKDKQDCLAMAALTYAVDNYKTRLSNVALEDDVLVQRLENIDILLDQLLK
ncbi:MAG: cell division protein ZapA [Bacteroidetes bacterium]|nr:MAG: cell division protein ZapA [Bacteroidota bacterium]